ncbi:enhanced serine sensitivity protein SseB [Clostridium felsineum]|uniref:enhanced serine sensitivity protein SseB n=1 Tax=Clostridium felsineum TaxID=36839 RepID=UPI00214D7847|nr:enhanced serine sensitivity protein SseB [Clostridium felsineum]
MEIAMLDEARKDQIGVVFLLKKDTSIKKIRRLNIQEIIFLICSARFFKSKQTIISDNFQKKIDIFTKVLLEKIKNADELFIIYDKNTEYPYIDSKGRVWIFSKEKYAVHVKDYFAKTMSLEVKRVIGQEVVNEFDNFYRLGIEKIIVDNGQYAVEIKRDEILKKFNSKNTLTINIPVENPKLQYSMIRFFQNLYDRDEYKGKKEFLSKLEVKMLDELVSAKYLVPIKVRNGAPIISREQINTVLNKKDTEIASIVSDDDTNWLPAFTDWEEFERIYHKNMWKGYIASYDELMELCSKMSGVVINCRGLALHIDEKNRRVLEQYEKGNEDIIEEKNEEEEEVVEKKVEPKDTQITLSEPEEYPKEMIEAIKEYMRSKKSINKAYLRLMMKNQNKSYLIVIDFSEKDKKVFDEIAEVAIPYLDGKYLDMVQMDKWAKEALVDVKPFYKKKFLGLF